MSFGPSQGLAAQSGVLSLGGGTLTGALLAPNGTVAAPSYSFSSETGLGIFRRGAANLDFAASGASICVMSATRHTVQSGAFVGWSSSSPDLADFDVALSRDAAAVLALKNGTTAQALRVYGTTTGSKYVDLSYSGTYGQLYTTSGPMFLGDNNANHWTLGSTVAGALEAYGGNYRFSHGTSALATNATEGFLHIQSCAGAPSGTPASIPSGQIPMVFDTTNSRLYIYHGAAWHYIAQTA